MEDIPKGQFIIEYYGDNITQEDCDSRVGKYFFEINKNKVVDGSPRYNIARYINHGCKPNCETDIVGGKIYIYSKKKIKSMQELSYDYGKEYFLDYIKLQGCKCSSCLKK